MSGEPFVRVEDLHRNFQMGQEVVHALDGVSFAVGKEESLSVVGRCGSGKSTLGYMRGGLAH